MIEQTQCRSYSLRSSPQFSKLTSYWKPHFIWELLRFDLFLFVCVYICFIETSFYLIYSFFWVYASFIQKNPYLQTLHQKLAAVVPLLLEFELNLLLSKLGTVCGSDFSKWHKCPSIVFEPAKRYFRYSSASNVTLPPSFGDTLSITICSYISLLSRTHNFSPHYVLLPSLLP